MAISALVGLAVTYYFDRDDNVRLHNILKYGLKLAGLLCMAFGTSMPEASVTLCCLLLLTQLVQPVLFLWSASFLPPHCPSPFPPAPTTPPLKNDRQTVKEV